MTFLPGKLFRLLFAWLLGFALLFPLFAAPALAKQLRLVFTGDIMAHFEQLKGAYSGSNFNKADNADFNFSHQFARISPYLQGDFVIGNFETVLAGPDKPYTGYPCFHAPDKMADDLTTAGFNTLLLANNHIFDKGANAAIRTRDVLAEKGFAVTGLFSPASENTPLILEKNGIRLGILNYTYGSNIPLENMGETDVALNVINKARILEDIIFLRGQKVDFIAALFHFGNEYQPKPSAAQKNIAQFCQMLGVDLLVGTHPHILQPMEWLYAAENNAKTQQVAGTMPTTPAQAARNAQNPVVPLEQLNMEDIFPTPPQWTGKNMFVAWSLGNFVSYQRTVPRERSVVLAVEIERPKSALPPVITRVSIMPTWVRNTKINTAGEYRQYLEILPLTDAQLQESPNLVPVRESIFSQIPATQELDGDFFVVWE